MLFPLEPGTDSILWRCPQCGRMVRFPNAQAANLADRAGLCRDCRFARTLERRPQLTWILKDFSDRSGLSYSFPDESELERDHPEDNIIPIDRYRSENAVTANSDSALL